MTSPSPGASGKESTDPLADDDKQCHRGETEDKETKEQRETEESRERQRDKETKTERWTKTDKEQRNRADANTNSSQLRPEVNTGGAQQAEAEKERS